MARPLTSGEEYRISAKNRYSAIIEAIFHARFQPGQREVDFERGDIVTIRLLNSTLPDLMRRPIGAQFMQQDVICPILSLKKTEAIHGSSRRNSINWGPQDAMTREDLIRYRQRLSDGTGG